MDYDNQYDLPFDPDHGEDVNPYASPETSCGGPAIGQDVEVHGAWRDGDLMVLICHNAVTPRACWVTNCDRFVHAFDETVDTELQQLIENILFWIPLVPLAFLPIRFSRRDVANLHIRLQSWRCVLRSCMQMSGFMLWVTGHFAVCLALAVGPLLVLVFAYALMLLAYLLFALANWPIKLEVVGGFVRVRGVHPDYLARLDEFLLRKPGN